MKNIDSIVQKHSTWLRGRPDGERADFSGQDLAAYSFSGLDLSKADFRACDLRGADFSNARLNGATFQWANLSGANLTAANCAGANFQEANLSGVSGIPPVREFLEQFERNAGGLIVYKAEGVEYAPPAPWSFSPGSILTETVNPDRWQLCGCGVSFATREHIAENYPGRRVWACFIEWLDVGDVVAPIGNDGKGRCRRLHLLEVVNEDSAPVFSGEGCELTLESTQ